MDVYLKEIEELTNLMRIEWDDFRSCVEVAGMDPSETLLVSFCEDEEGDERSILITQSQKIIECTRNTEKGPLECFQSIEELDHTLETFGISPAIEIALKLVSNA